MSSKQPLVSIIIPTYNYAKFIGEAIDSVLLQTYPRKKMEIIVVDDGSTDNTAEVLKPFIDRGLIRYYSQSNQGKARATARAILESRGKYIFNLDADDYFLPEKVSSTVSVFEAYPEVVHVASPAKMIHEDSGDAEIENLPPDLLERPIDGKLLLERFYQNNILFGGGTTYAARGTVLRPVSIPDGVDMYTDEFLILAILPFGKTFFLREALSVWRIHSSNYSGKSNSQESQVKKEERLLRSSAAVLNYLETHPYDKQIVRIYRLQHATRQISCKELMHNKGIQDIIHYAKLVFFSIQPGWKLIRKYHVLNRLLPSHFLYFMKKIWKPA
jgi:glycosyltransferase involved in cell wall biosynthesis